LHCHLAHISSNRTHGLRLQGLFADLSYYGSEESAQNPFFSFLYPPIVTSKFYAKLSEHYLSYLKKTSCAGIMKLPVRKFESQSIQFFLALFCYIFYYQQIT
jgi:hypothetical protein